VLPTGTGTEVGGEPTTAADAGADDAVADEVGRWSRSGTLSGTSVKHYRTKQPQLPLLGFLVSMD
jgi:hypothetical protein